LWHALNIWLASQCSFHFSPHEVCSYRLPIGLYSEQEHKRTQSSSNIDDRTMHEIYAQPFLKSIMAGVGSLMCSYSTLSFQVVFRFHDWFFLCFDLTDMLYFSVDLLNGTYACENDKVMNDIIKREFGFQGCEFASILLRVTY